MDFFYVYSAFGSDLEQVRAKIISFTEELQGWVSPVPQYCYEVYKDTGGRKEIQDGISQHFFLLLYFPKHKE